VNVCHFLFDFAFFTAFFTAACVFLLTTDFFFVTGFFFFAIEKNKWIYNTFTVTGIGVWCKRIYGANALSVIMEDNGSKKK